ncbi:MAG TPA: hypothetical protein VKM55_26840 [Candidatus Lokiarchaeia archaeon]|nr:hypothetical protein [Candidatus Lokiarchaeia archaeon]
MGENEIDPGQELVFRKIAREEAERVSQSINVEALKEHFLTRGEFLDAMERMDKRFESMQGQMDKRFDAMLDALKGMHQDIKKIAAEVGAIGSRSGKELEATILELMNDQLVKHHVDYTSIVTEDLVDDEGTYFTPGTTTDVDVVATADQGTWLFEIKYHPDQRDVEHFVKAASLWEHIHGEAPTKLYLVGVEISSKTMRHVARLPVDVDVIAGSVVL